ncbi:hypothetical protein JNX00_08990 [Hydrogenophaga sp. YM1]|uniref:hypothetical protein n=1 Tax=Hydrogenophaga sp. YM1 TaxID=2806262 RepID=UPI00195AFF2D|nr:hypothetical protein [Hydrogenophaga sp. YM1]QRR35969.1 hypothetical protein JNX00_08990 [Hydrogenophaga sp. YM1]
MNASLLIGVALGLSVSVLVARPGALHQILLLGTSAALFVAASLLEQKWVLLVWQLVGIFFVLLIVRLASRSLKKGVDRENH